MSRGTMPQPEAWPGASCAETPAREGGKAAASGQPRPEMQCPAEQTEIKRSS
ncbi:OTULIN isoform 3 [Pan troglodytes]|uniref:OTULIN isoform 3 n=1 Tax=Pan troglodytes TaxID=9598 RepID=A0A2J8L4L6_PANTR|nr:OTULIN isoform 3 [Pan troglodytes]